MIFDNIKNLAKYNIDKEICDFILNIDPDIKAGRYIVNENVYVNIDEYETRLEPKLEAHKTNIDIQFVLKGKEKVYTTDLAELEILEPYNKEKDIEFYKTPNRPLNVSCLTPGKFILLTPDDVHGPCVHYSNSKESVKKGVVKILFRD